MRDAIGKLGVWSMLDTLDPKQAVDFAQRIEALGYGCLWSPEAVGRDPFALSAFLGAHTTRLCFATGIANIYARDPMGMVALHRSLSDLLEGRFILGLGASHAHLVQKLRGHTYEKPVPAMRAYLDAMDGALYMGHQPKEAGPIVLAALRPIMQKLGATRTAGVHPYLVTPEHTRRARERIGAAPLLCPEQKVLLEGDPARARGVARTHLKVYVRLPNYQNNLRDLGFTDADFSDGGSDRLVDALVAWGDVEAIRARIAEHHTAGADHVCVQPLRPDGSYGPHLELLEQLAG